MPDGQNNDVPNNPDVPPQPDAKDAQTLLTAILNSQRVSGDTSKALEVLAGQVVRKDTRIGELEGRQLKDEDAQLLTSVRELIQATGVKSLDELKAALEEGTQAKTTLSQRDRADAMRVACEAAGIDYADFSTRKGVDDWQYEVKDETRDGKPVKVATVTFKDGDKDVTKPLADHAAAVFPTIAKAGSTQARPVVPFSGTPAGGGSAPTVWDDIRNKKKKDTDTEQPKNWREQVGVAP